MSNIVLHLGFPKTGSTTLQTQYFPVCENLVFINRSTVNAMNQFINMVTNTSPIYFDANDARNILCKHLKDDRINFISAENLSGRLMATSMLPGLDFRLQILQNLKSTYESARIVLVIRRQDGLVRSTYREYLQQGGTKRLSRFFGVPEKQDNPGVISGNYFLFKPYIDALHELFPSGVLILAFEEFVREQEIFIGKLNTFLGINRPRVVLTKTNDARLGAFGLEVTRWINNVFRSKLNPAGLIPGVPYRKNGAFSLKSPTKYIHNYWPGSGKISPSSRIYMISKDIFNRCKDDNKALDDAYGLGLEKYGYW